MIYSGLAYWIRDDGSKHGKGLHLNTYNFSEAEHILLINVLKTKFNLNVSVHPHSAHGGKGRLYIKVESINKLRNLVMPHMIPSMHYKLG